MRLQHRRTRSRPERVRRSRPGHPFRGLEGTPRMRRRRIRPIAGQDRSARVTAPGRVVARMRLMPGPRHRICRYGRTWISLCGSAGAGLSLPSEAASCGRGHGQAGPGAAFDQSATAPALGDLAPVSARSAPRRTTWGFQCASDGAGWRAAARHLSPALPGRGQVAGACRSVHANRLPCGFRQLTLLQGRRTIGTSDFQAECGTYSPARVATPAGFEPATYRLGGGCSILLSYGADAGPFSWQIGSRARGGATFRNIRACRGR